MNRLMVAGIVLLLTVSISDTQDIQFEVQNEEEGAVTTKQPRQIQTPLGTVDVDLLERKGKAGMLGAAKGALGPDLIKGAIGGLAGGPQGIAAGAASGAAIGAAKGGLAAAIKQRSLNGETHN